MGTGLSETTESNRSAPIRLVIARAIAVVHLVFGLLVTAGYVFHIDLLVFRRGRISVAPNTALLFFLTGLAVLLLSSKRWKLGSAIAALVVVLSTWCLIERMVQPLPAADLLPGTASYLFIPLIITARIAIPTACSFWVLGVALLFLRRSSLVVDVACVGVFGVSLFSVLGYAYGMPYIYNFLMALATSIMFLLSAVMVIASAERSWIRESLAKDDAGGVVLRRICVVSFVALPLIGASCLWLENRNLVPFEFGFTLLVLASIALLLIVAFVTGSRLSHAAARAQAANEALIRSEKLATAGRLAASVAHEINNPLAAALNSVFIARNNATSENRHLFLDLAERELKRVAGVVRQSLGFYRGEGKTGPVEVNAMLQEAVDLFLPMASTRRVTLEHKAEQDISVTADFGELRQVVCNLIANAIDANEAGGRVLVSSTRGWNGDVEIAVEDWGPGIPAAAKEKIFEPFYTTKPNVGSGLGLFVVKELVQKNGGRLSLATNTDELLHGTRFTLTFSTMKSRNAAAS